MVKLHDAEPLRSHTPEFILKNTRTRESELRNELHGVTVFYMYVYLSL